MAALFAPPDQATETDPIQPHNGDGGSTHPRGALRLVFAQGCFDGTTSWRVGESGILLGRQTLASTGRTDPHLSREHAAIQWDTDGWVLKDLGSRNRSRINGQEVDKSFPLHSGDLLRLGSTLFFWSDKEDGAEPLPPEPDLVGNGRAMRALRRSIEAVAGHSASVLITGETGTGKEMVARVLHRRSGRPGLFVALNCGGLAEGVLESELFGHVRGAFTGAVAAREGLLRAADRGTLFLDELGEMPLGVQVKLLRVLETRRVRPVGATQETAIDVRVLAATNCDLLAAMREGRFRADLYARLGQWLISVPPLRDRRDDLPDLIVHLLGRLNAADRPLDVMLAETLLLHDWPLNVRGLFNVLSSAAIASPTGTPIGLGPQVEWALAAERALRTPAVAVAEDPEPSVEVAVPTRAVIQAALMRHHGKMVDVARTLGCSRSRLYRWCAAYGIDPDEFRSRPRGFTDKDGT